MTLHIPAQPIEALHPITLIADGLLNPRGLCPVSYTHLTLPTSDLV